MSNPAQEEGARDLGQQTTQLDGTVLPKLESVQLGSSVGRYRLLSVLGRGGMGVVYLAEDEALRREVALKVLSPDTADDQGRRRRLLREAQAAAAVSHPNIAAVYDVGESNGMVYIAMERIAGTSLRNLMDRGAMPIDQVVGIARNILAGLAAAHDVGIIHRDLKPDNIMVDSDGFVKILDFGLAKFLDNEERPMRTNSTLTEVGQFLGTPSYMSPEQAAGLSLDARSDVFSFGIVLYEMVTGELPFRGSNVLKILAAIERDEPAAASQKNAKTPAYVEKIIARCLAKEPDQRYGNAREILQEFESEGTKSSARVSPPSEQIRKWRWVALLAAVLVLASIGVWLQKIKSSSPTTTPLGPSAALPAPTTMPVTALPPSKSDNPSAIAAYREGLQALRDSAWPAAQTAFQRAATLDPTFASAFLRLALTALQEDIIPDEGRIAYRKAVSLRTDLNERDRRLLDALTLIYQRDPPDLIGLEKRLKEISSNARLDVEFLMLASSVFFAPSISPTTRLQAAEDCLRLDPQYADCLQLKAWTLERLGRVDEAIATYNHCVAISPAASDCLVYGMNLHMQDGQCGAMEDAARRILMSDDAPKWRHSLAVALLARGEDLNAVHKVLEQVWEKTPEAQRASTRNNDELQLALLSGRLEEAEKFLIDGNNAAQKVMVDQVQSMSARSLIRYYELMNRPKEAAQVAETYLNSKSALTKGLFDSLARTDMTLFFMKRKLDGGLMSRDAFVKEREHWLARRKLELTEDMQPYLWQRAYVELIMTVEDAREALAAMPPQWKSVEFYNKDATSAHAALGRMYLWAGNPSDAISHLERATKDCGILLNPIGNTLGHYHLGMAREATGNKSAACAAYRVVLNRWGQAKPQIEAANDARRRAVALDCSAH